MSLIDEVKGEILKSHKQHQNPAVTPAAEPQAAEPERRRRRRSPEDMTAEEREKWLQKKREEEEARCLQASGNAVSEKSVSGKPVRRLRRKSKKAATAVNAKKQLAKARSDNPKTRRPKMLQPLETLYLLRIPGLPKGDCIAICYAKGADQ